MIKKRTLYKITCVFILLMSTFVYGETSAQTVLAQAASAQPTPPPAAATQAAPAQPTPAVSINLLDVNEQINEIYDSISLSLDYETVYRTLHELNALSRKIDQCSAFSKEQLEDLTQILQTKDLTNIFKLDSSQYKNLQFEKFNNEQLNVYCKYFHFRIQKVRSILEARLAEKKAYVDINQDEPSIIESLHHLNISSFNFRLFYQSSGLADLIKEHLMPLVCLFLLAVMITYASYKISMRFLCKYYPKIGLTNYLSQLKYYLIFALPFLMVCVALNRIFNTTEFKPAIVIVFNFILLYIIILGVLKVIFSLENLKNVKFLEKYKERILLLFIIITNIAIIITARLVVLGLNFVPLINLTQILVTTFAILYSIVAIYPAIYQEKNIIISKLSRLSKALIAIILLHVLLKNLPNQSQALYIFALFNAVIITLSNLLFVQIIKEVLKLKTFRKITFKESNFFKTLSAIILIVVTIFGWRGYQKFAFLFVSKIIVTVMIFYLAFHSIRYLGILYQRFSDPQYPLSLKFHKLLSLPPANKLIELFILRIIFCTPILVTSISALIETWYISPYAIALFGLNFMNVFSLSGGNVNIGAIIRASGLFCILTLLCRGVISQIEKRFFKNLDKHSQITFSTTLRYMLFSIAFLLAFTAAGVNFKNIAFIAGALSVGLGFGLQNFARDFVSGILLLLNKPIQIGDHAILDGKEGFIKKIGLLSTQLRTLEQTDIIIPNSSLVLNSIINLTFQTNRRYRLEIQVVLIDPKQLDLAQKVLLEIATTQSEIIQTPPLQPIIGFELNNSLILRCVIEDVNRKEQLISAINLAITKKFAEQGINFTLPAAP